MALLTDGALATIDDLAAHDSSLLETAKTENIQLDLKLELTEEEARLETAVFLLRSGDSNLVASETGPVQVGKVVVTDCFHRWLTLKALAATYSDAHNSQLNDRYLGKWEHFSKLARETADILFEVGVGVVVTPVPRAARPSVEGSGSTGAHVDYTVQVAWTNATGAEGAPSEAVVFAAQNGERLRVGMDTAPAGVSGFHVYAAVAGNRPERQTASPVPVGQPWIMPDSGLAAGPKPGDGQTPDYYVRRNRMLRG